jgi:hypothetical protein
MPRSIPAAGAGWALAAAAVIAAANPAAAVPLRPVALRSEYAVNPMGIDRAEPSLSWKLEGGGRGERQTAYRIMAASSKQKLEQDQGDLWDSGKTPSDETVGVSYKGRPLRSSERVFWKVRVWDGNLEASAWSEPAEWTMGILRPEEWRAAWVGAASPSETVLLRRGFAVRKNLVRAVIHVCGLGQFVLTVNGRRVGDDLLAPGWTKYDRTCLYETYDLTALVREGANAAGLFLTNGFYNVKGGRYAKYAGSFGPLKAIAQIRLEYADGRAEFIGTNRSWRTRPGPVTFACVYGGEDFDARLVEPGWDDAAFDGRAWPRAVIVPGPGGALRGASFAAPPIRAFETLEPVSVRKISPRVAVYDLGQNAPLMARLTARGPVGSSVRVIPAELLKADGTIDRRSAGGGLAYWQYTLAGSGAETYVSEFFYHGARYLQVELSPAERDDKLPDVEALEGVVVHSSAPAAGEFASSFDLFNRVRRLVRWAQRANLMSVLTDCPHREKLGWLEQSHLNGPSLRYEWDLSRLSAKTTGDMSDSQLASGLVPDIAPEYTVFQAGFRDSPEWGSAAVIVPWQEYEWTGDLVLLRRHYPAMKRYVEYLGSKAEGHIVSHGLGDWYDLGPKPPGEAQLTPRALTATAFYQLDTVILSRAARLLMNLQDAKVYERRAAEIARAFNDRFFDPVKGVYAAGSQTANALPLVLGLVPDGRRAAVLEAVVRDVRSRGNALTAGDVGFRYLLRALADGGRSDVIFDLTSRSDRPGYGYQLKMGATSLTEAWDAGPASSQNHFMLGHIVEWLYGDLAGLSPDPAGPGFKRILVRPQPVGGLTWARAGLDTVRGKVEVEWRVSGGRLSLAVSIPPNASATVFVPASSAAAVAESGRPAGESPGVTFLRQEGGRAVFEVGSGRYAFEVAGKR